MTIVGKLTRLHALLLLACCLLVLESAASEETGKFIRVRRDKNNVVTALDSAISRYSCTDKTGTAFDLDLIAAVHVADKNYYQSLNDRFKSYDALLYELIAPEGFRPKQQEPSNSSVSSFQLLITSLLGLSFQLQEVDYGLPNMVHADMSPEQFSKTMEERQESFLKMFIQLMARSSIQGISAEEEAPDLASMLMVFSKNGQYRARKRLLAAEFGKMESVSSLIEDSGGSSILSARNAVAMEKIRDQISKGKRKLGVFYGAAHLPGIEALLKENYSVKETGTSWMTAWDMTVP